MTITDELDMPCALSITIGNTTGNTLNSRENIYNEYQKVRVIEGNSGRIIFYGKIERILPSFDGAYGQQIEIVAHDNLNELLMQEVNENVTYTGTPRRSEIIEDIINGGGVAGEFSAHAWQGTPKNIGTSDTDKFVASGSTEAANVMNTNLSNSSKNPLRVIEELALEDPQTTTTHLTGHDFYLDTEFDALASSSAGNAQPDLHYFSRGTVPGTPATNGLTLQFRGVNGDQIRSILPNYSFPREAAEIVTRVRAEYVKSTDDGRQPATKEMIFINHDAPSATFSGETSISWPGGNSAIIEKVMDDDLGLVISSNGNTTWLNTISGVEITSSPNSRTATVNATSADPPGSIREAIAQDVEVVVRDYESENLEKVVKKATEILQHGGDIVIRGNVDIIKWPYHKITGTHTAGTSATVLTDTGASFVNNGVQVGDEVTNTTDSITGLVTARTATDITVGAGGMSWDGPTPGPADAYEFYIMARAGHAVYVKDFPPVTDQNAVITKIEYVEGPGVQRANLELLLLANNRGAGKPKNSLRNIANKMHDSLLPTVGQTGIKNVSELKWSYSGNLTAPTANQVDWSAGTLSLSDKRTFSIIPGGNTGTITTEVFVYFDLATPTVFQTSNTLGDATGIDKTLIFIAEKGVATTIPSWTVNGEMATPINVDGTAILSFDTSILGWNTTLVFSATDADTVSWASGGQIILSDGTTYTITTAPLNTGNMSARNYIYLDINVSTSQLQVSTTASDAVGTGKLLVATAKNGTGEANFFVFSGNAETVIDGAFVATGTLAANKIIANTIDATQITAEYVLSNKFVTEANVGEAGSGVAGIKISSNGIQGFSSGNTETFQLDPANGNITAAAGGVLINASGLTVTTGTLTGATIQTSVSNPKVILTSTEIQGIGSDGTVEWEASTTDGKFAAGAGALVLDRSGMTVVGTLATAITFRTAIGGTIIGELIRTTSTGNKINLIALTDGASVYDLNLQTTGAGTDILLDAANDVVSTGLIRPSSAGGVTNLGTLVYQWGTVYTANLSGGLLSLTKINNDFNPSSGGVHDLGSATDYWKQINQSICNTNRIIMNGYQEFTESSYPGWGAANTARIYAVDNGAGKTELRVVFSSGVSQLIAAEP